MSGNVMDGDHFQEETTHEKENLYADAWYLLTEPVVQWFTDNRT